MILVGIFALFTLVWFNTFKVMDLNPRYSIDQAIMHSFGYMLTNPFEAFTNPSPTAGVFYMITLMVVGFGLFFMFNNQRPKDDGPNVKGDAHFMTDKELDIYNKKHVLNPYYGPNEETVEDVKDDGSLNGKKLFKKNPSTQVEDECRRQACIISSSVFLSFDNNWSRKNTNALIVGTAGSGKSRYYVGPNILQCNTNYIITDPSGDLFSQYAKFLENNGYDVKKLDLNDMYDSERYNPLKYLEDEKDVFTLVNMLIENLTAASGGSGKEEPIWKDSKSALLRAVIFYLWEYESDPKRKNFTNVLRLINSAKIDESKTSNDDSDNYMNPFDEIFERIRKFDPTSQAVTQYDIFQSAGTGKTRDSILITTTSQLSLFGSSNIAHLTSSDEMDLDSFADKKSALFICIPTEDNTFNFLASLLYSQLFLKLYNYAEKRSKYSWHVYIDYVEHDVHHNENIKVFQAKDEKDSERAKAEAEALLEKIKNGHLKTVYDKNKDLWYIKTNDEEEQIIAWRGGTNGEEKINELLKHIKKYAAVRPGDDMRLPEHCHFILDEFANTGKIPTFCEKLSTIRKYRINCSIIVQSPDQLKNMYEKEYNVIVDNCNIKLFLGTNSPETAKWVSDTLGNKTVVARSESWNSGNNGGSESFQKDKQELMTADKVLAMKDYECVAMVYGGNNIYEQKYEISNHPNYKEATKYRGKFKAQRIEKKVDERDKAALFASSSVQKNENENSNSMSKSTPKMPPKDKTNQKDTDQYNSSDDFDDDAMNEIANEQSSETHKEIEDDVAAKNEKEKALAKRDMENEGKDIKDKAFSEQILNMAKNMGINENTTDEEMVSKYVASTSVVDGDDEDDMEFAFGSSSF